MTTIETAAPRIQGPVTLPIETVGSRIDRRAAAYAERQRSATDVVTEATRSV